MKEIPVTDEKAINRRMFLTRLSIWSGVVAASLVSIPFLGALLDPVLGRKSQKWRTVGKLSDFPVGSTNLVSFINADPEPYGGVTDKTAAWLRRESEREFIAFAVNCTHLGCPVRWEQKADLFMCPCHGGVYFRDGSVASGPPPKALNRYMVRVEKDTVQIKTAPVPLTRLNA